MFSLTKKFLGKKAIDIFNISKFSFAREVGDVNHIKKFKAKCKSDDSGITSFFGEENSILINQPLETLLSCLSTCELKSIAYWANENKIKINRLEISTDAFYDSRNSFKNNEGKDITHKISEESKEKKEGTKEEVKTETKETKNNDKSQKDTKDSKQTEKTNEDKKVVAEQSTKEGVKKYSNKKNSYEEVNIEITIKTDEKDKNKVIEVLKKGQETCPIYNMLQQSGININSRFNIL